MFMLVNQGSIYFEKLLSLWPNRARGSPAVIVLPQLRQMNQLPAFRWASRNARGVIPSYR
jgi:hypothetical protein